MSVFMLTANAQEKKTYDWTRVINAIIQVESKGNAKAVSKDCVGVMQIRPILVRDVNEYLKMKGSSKRYTLNDRFSPEKYLMSASCRSSPLSRSVSFVFTARTV